MASAHSGPRRRPNWRTSSWTWSPNACRSALGRDSLPRERLRARVRSYRLRGVLRYARGPRFTGDRPAMHHTLQLKILDPRIGSDWPLPAYPTEARAGLALRAALYSALVLEPGDAALEIGSASCRARACPHV